MTEFRLVIEFWFAGRLRNEPNPGIGHHAGGCGNAAYGVVPALALGRWQGFSASRVRKKSRAMVVS